MEKSLCRYAREGEKLEELEGIVEFSENKITLGGWDNLTLRLKDFDREIWIRGQHRIDVGEKIKIYYSNRHYSPRQVVAEDYEILSENDGVKYRYRGRTNPY